MGVCTPVMQIRCKPISCGKAEGIAYTQLQEFPQHHYNLRFPRGDLRASGSLADIQLLFLCILFRPLPHPSTGLLCGANFMNPSWSPLLDTRALYGTPYRPHSSVQVPCMEPHLIPAPQCRCPVWSPVWTPLSGTGALFGPTARYRHPVWSPIWIPHFSSPILGTSHLDSTPQHRRPVWPPLPSTSPQY